MRKWMTIIIIVVYIGSVVFIAFFGGKLATYNPVVYTQRIECINEELRTDEQGYKWIMLQYQQGMVYSLKWNTYPQDATDKRVEFVYTPSDSYEVSFYGEILFLNAEPLIISIVAADGGGAKETVEILLRL